MQQALSQNIHVWVISYFNPFCQGDDIVDSFAFSVTEQQLHDTDGSSSEYIGVINSTQKLTYTEIGKPSCCDGNLQFTNIRFMDSTEKYECSTESVTEYGYTITFTTKKITYDDILFEISLPKIKTD